MGLINFRINSKHTQIKRIQHFHSIIQCQSKIYNRLCETCIKNKIYVVI